jgi:tRNA nucleotidyltransferase (CCA-adding enzyme)
MRHPKIPPAAAVKIIGVCTRIRESGGRAYLVGGCVRDMFLGIVPKDWDLEVFGLKSDILAALFPDEIDLVGSSFGIYKFKHFPLDMGIPREESAAGVGHRDFDVRPDPHLPLAAAAARRDFTFNAIYWDPLEDSLKDPFGGCNDLHDKKLRHVSAKFGEDPLRVLRGMQFLARFNLTADEKTIAICQTLTPINLSAERIYWEFCKLIRFGRSIGNGIEFLRQAHWLPFFPELEALENCQQDPVHHPEGSVLRHIECTLDVFAKLRPNDDWDTLVTGFAVLCHDFGKPACTHWNSHGRLSSKGHERAGLEPTEQFLHRMRAPKRLVKEVLPLVEFHMIPRTFARSDAATASVLNHLAYRVQRIDRLLVVARCDNIGRPPHVPDLSGEDTLELMAKEAKLFKNPPKPIIQGRDLQRHFGLRPSPKMGAILRQLLKAQLDGEFLDYETALICAQKLVKSSHTM